MSKKPKEITEPYGFVGGKMLKELLEKEPDALTKDEMDILRARRSYLNEEQLEKYEISDDGAEPEEEEEEEKEEEEVKEVDLSKFSVKELKELAEEEAIDIKGLKTKDELIDAISAADESEDEDEDEEEEE